VLGGSFNPVHVAHVAFAAALADLPDVTQVLAVPAALNPLKSGATLLPAELRWDMARVALGHLPKVSVLDLELRRAPPSYTLDTLHQLRALYPAATFDLALGWDAYRDIAQWHRVNEVLALAGLLVAPRVPADAGVAPPLSGSSHAADVVAPLRPGSASPPIRSPDSLDDPAWLSPLPPGWADRLRAAGDGQWRDATGRGVVRVLDIHLPDVAASDILAHQRWDQVPAAARALLLRHLGTTPAALDAAPADRQRTEPARTAPARPVSPR
jgi:nicotinate (nicotinamide) nucleotide adenylyltransferase